MTVALIAYGAAATALLVWSITYGVPLRYQWLERLVDRLEQRVAQVHDREDDMHGCIVSLEATLNDAHGTETRLRRELALAAAKLHEAHTATEWPPR